MGTRTQLGRAPTNLSRQPTMGLIDLLEGACDSASRPALVALGLYNYSLGCVRFKPGGIKSARSISRSLNARLLGGVAFRESPFRRAGLVLSSSLRREETRRRNGQTLEQSVSLCGLFFWRSMRAFLPSHRELPTLVSPEVFMGGNAEIYRDLRKKNERNR